MNIYCLIIYLLAGNWGWSQIAVQKVTAFSEKLEFTSQFPWKLQKRSPSFHLSISDQFGHPVTVGLENGSDVDAWNYVGHMEFKPENEADLLIRVKTFDVQFSSQKPSVLLIVTPNDLQHRRIPAHNYDLSYTLNYRLMITNQAHVVLLDTVLCGEADFKFPVQLNRTVKTTEEQLEDYFNQFQNTATLEDSASYICAKSFARENLRSSLRHILDITKHHLSLELYKLSVNGDQQTRLDQAEALLHQVISDFNQLGSQATGTPEFNEIRSCMRSHADSALTLYAYFLKHNGVIQGENPDLIKTFKLGLLQNSYFLTILTGDYTTAKAMLDMINSVYYNFRGYVKKTDLPPYYKETILSLRDWQLKKLLESLKKSHDLVGEDYLKR